MRLVGYVAYGCVFILLVYVISGLLVECALIGVIKILGLAEWGLRAMAMFVGMAMGMNLIAA